MDKNTVFTVKIYFIEPVELISIIHNSLIELEFEAYSVPFEYRENLISVIPENNRNIIFISVRNKHDVEEYIQYADKIQKIAGDMVQFGAFVYDSIDSETRNKFLERNISTIDFALIKKDTLAVMKNILMMFEARGKRAYIRTKVVGDCKAYFYIKNKNYPIISVVTDISAYAFSCDIEKEYISYFPTNEYIEEVALVLRGMRIKTTVKIVGFSKDDTTKYIMKFCNYKIESDKIIYEDKPLPENTRKIHEYIKKCLQETIIQRFQNEETKK